MALTLARPEGNARGLARARAVLRRDCATRTARSNGIHVNRLKDKLGTRKVPTAELTLDGAPAIPVAGLTDGVRAITPMLTVTRTWNAIAAVAGMRRALALARDYARRRSGVRRAARREAAARRHARGARGRVRGGVPARVPRGAAARRARRRARRRDARAALAARADADREADDRASRRSRSRRRRSSASAAPATSRTPACRGCSRDAQVLPIWEGTTNVLVARRAARARARAARSRRSRREIERHARRRRRPGAPARRRGGGAALARARAWVAATAGPASSRRARAGSR